jgi:pimeloyl-ACP methyl ester carboxylesterase
VFVTALVLTALIRPSLEEQVYLKVGGIYQWIDVKSNDRRNPIVLFLHGGPGNPYSPYADSMFAGWENDYTLAQWDQRGAGRTFGKNGTDIEPTMTMERMVADGLEVSEFLAQHLGQKKIILVGGSWGSFLGIEMIRQRPELFSAYIGLGQMVNWRENVKASYARVLQMARVAKDQASVDALTALGPPPWDTIRKWPRFREIVLAYQAKRVTSPPIELKRSPIYDSYEERQQYAAGDDFSFLHFIGPTMSGPETQIDLPALGTDFKVPVYMIQGEQDLIAVPDVTKAYFESLKAPKKKLYMVPGTGHEPSAAELNMLRKVIDEAAGR